MAWRCGLPEARITSSESFIPRRVTDQHLLRLRQRVVFNRGAGAAFRVAVRRLLGEAQENSTAVGNSFAFSRRRHRAVTAQTAGGLIRYRVADGLQVSDA
ncbi:hypothetical protein KCP78_09605 [Salmonella enterica subsp. enterica]|nr:hypothetical protein KCP78_09605 [Salmonella enterica subsp. enterica]